MVFLYFGLTSIEASAMAVKTPGRGFVLTRFLLPFYRLEKEGPIRPEDKIITLKDDPFLPNSLICGKNGEIDHLIPV